MPSRFPPISLFLVLGTAGLAALLLIPADPNAPQVSSLSVGDEAAEAAVAKTTPLQTVDPITTGSVALLAVDPMGAVVPPTTTSTVASIAHAETPEPEAIAWVAGSAVNLRAGPSTAAAKLLVLQPGARVSVTEHSGDWASVVAESGETGWVYARYLSTSAVEFPTPQSVSMTAEEPVPRIERKYGRVSGAVMLRAGPSPRAAKLFVLTPGERIAIAEQRGRWVRVVLESGASAWVDSAELSR